MADGAGFVDLGGQFLNPRHHLPLLRQGGNGISSAKKIFSLKRFRVSSVLPVQVFESLLRLPLGKRNQYSEKLMSIFHQPIGMVGNSPVDDSNHPVLSLMTPNAPRHANQPAVNEIALQHERVCCDV